jgi:hypothetical protein
LDINVDEIKPDTFCIESVNIGTILNGYRRIESARAEIAGNCKCVKGQLNRVDEILASVKLTNKDIGVSSLYSSVVDTYNALCSSGAPPILKTKSSSSASTLTTARWMYFTLFVAIGAMLL